MSQSRTPFVSVIIPVYRHLHELAGCLAAVTDQTWPSDSCEVIVVDNEGTHAVRDLCRRFPIVRYVFAATSGSYAARNAGVRAARGDILAFTDADCLPKRDWLEAGVARLGRNDCEIVAGQVEFFVKKVDRPTALEWYDLMTSIPQRYLAEVERYGATANLFVRSSLFSSVGLFDETLLSGGDRDWGRRAAGQGARLAFAAEACVRHPARQRWRDLAIHTRRIAGGEWRAARGWPMRRVLRRARLFNPIPKVWAQIARDRRLDTLAVKAAVAAVAIVLRVVKIGEACRLTCAGQPERR